MDTELDTVPQKPLTIPVYIMYAEGFRCKDSELETVVELAEEQQLAPMYVPQDRDLFMQIEDSIKRGDRVADIFQSLHSTDISSFEIFWFAGSGSNAFARALLAYLHHPHQSVIIEDYTKEGSILGRYLKWFERQKIVVEESKERRCL